MTTKRRTRYSPLLPEIGAVTRQLLYHARCKQCDAMTSWETPREARAWLTSHYKSNHVKEATP